jgi:hypothetical protein
VSAQDRVLLAVPDLFSPAVQQFYSPENFHLQLLMGLAGVVRRMALGSAAVKLLPGAAPTVASAGAGLFRPAVGAFNLGRAAVGEVETAYATYGLSVDAGAYLANSAARFYFSNALTVNLAVVSAAPLAFELAGQDPGPVDPGTELSYAVQLGERLLQVEQVGQRLMTIEIGAVRTASRQPSAEAVTTAEKEVIAIIHAKYPDAIDISDLTKGPYTPGADFLFVLGRGDGVQLLEVDAKLSLQEAPVAISEVSSFDTARRSGGASRVEALDRALLNGRITPHEHGLLRDDVASGLVLEEVHGFGSVSGISRNLREGQVTYEQGDQFAHIAAKMADRAVVKQSRDITKALGDVPTDRRTARQIGNEIIKELEKKLGTRQSP